MTLSEPIKHKPLLIIEPEFEWEQSITINSDLNYFYVPSIPEWAYYEYDGLLYEGVQYNWNEVDYRLSADLAIPEPASAGVIIGLLTLAVILINKYRK
tara:strand:+ start:376 stop:669 length:294 start_codon:yes stop_codon:yes gene_type:complete